MSNYSTNPQPGVETAFNLKALLQELVAKRGENTCLIFQDNAQSFGELDRASNRLASFIKARGLEPGARVGIISKNSNLFYELLFGCAKSGAIFLPLNWRLSKEEIESICLDAKPDILFVENEFKGSAGALVEHGVTVLGIEEDYARLISNCSADDMAYVPDTQDPVLMLYTSGTTGKAKGVPLTHGNLFYTTRMAREVWNFTEQSVNLVCMPLFHIGGMGYGLMALSQGGKTVVSRQPDAASLAEAITEHGVTHTFSVPTIIQSIVNLDTRENYDFSSLELVVYGGADMSPTLLEQAVAFLDCDFTHAYGLTETSGTVITMPPLEHREAMNRPELLKSCGKAVPWAEIRLVNPDSQLETQPGEVGEIWVRSGMTMHGYWHNPTETEKSTSPDGWFKSGDAALKNEEGYFFLKDRFKDMIVSGGENIYPTEIENVIYELPEVAECAVIGVPHDKWGETPVAIIVAKKGLVLTGAEVMEYIKSKIARYKCPSKVFFVESLPHNSSAKILKSELRKMNWAR